MTALEAVCHTWGSAQPSAAALTCLLQKVDSAVDHARANLPLHSKFPHAADPWDPIVASSDSSLHRKRNREGEDDQDVLNYSELQLLRLKSNHKLTYKGADAVLSLLADPRVRPEEIRTRKTKTPRKMDSPRQTGFGLGRPLRRPSVSPLEAG